MTMKDLNVWIAILRAWLTLLAPAHFAFAISRAMGDAPGLGSTRLGIFLAASVFLADRTSRVAITDWRVWRVVVWHWYLRWLVGLATVCAAAVVMGDHEATDPLMRLLETGRGYSGSPLQAVGTPSARFIIRFWEVFGGSFQQIPGPLFLLAALFAAVLVGRARPEANDEGGGIG
jgi:hypothetical protein